jgi:ascorbate-specific PTS system EIIC-type component UlaA
MFDVETEDEKHCQYIIQEVRMIVQEVYMAFLEAETTVSPQKSHCIDMTVMLPTSPSLSTLCRSYNDLLFLFVPHSLHSSLILGKYLNRPFCFYVVCVLLTLITIHSSLFIVYCLLFIVYCLLFIVYCLLSNVWIKFSDNTLENSLRRD